MDISAIQQEKLLNAARNSVRQALQGSAGPTNEAIAEGLGDRAGCFVTLHSMHPRRLRGCVGQLVSDDPLLISVQKTAASALRDPRFVNDPVTLHELNDLDVEITVLSPLRPAASPLDFDPQEHGIFLSIGQRGGCFLPQVARETGWSREQLLNRLCTEKMGLTPNAWQQRDVKLQIFTTFIVGPEPLIAPGLGQAQKH